MDHGERSPIIGHADVAIEDDCRAQADLMWQHRITDPELLDRAEIAALLQPGHRVIVQFSRPGYTPGMLQELNGFAQDFGRDFEIRFYGHGHTGFDASVLVHIPNAVSLSLDCLRSAKNLGTLSVLTSLKECSLGIFELDDPGILSLPVLHAVERMTISETRRKDVDLQGLRSCTGLSYLHVTGQRRNLAVVGDLPRLRSLSLSQMGKDVDLSFVARIAGLENLRLIVGGRSAIDDITGDALRNLHIIRVRGLESVGDLRRFPRLERLMVEDQIRIAAITCPDGGRLKGLFVNNCKTLMSLPGLASLPMLEHLNVYQTAIDYDALLAAGLPAALRVFGFYTGRARIDHRIRADLDRRGFAERDATPGAMPDF